MDNNRQIRRHVQRFNADGRKSLKGEPDEGAKADGKKSRTDKPGFKYDHEDEGPAKGVNNGSEAQESNDSQASIASAKNLKVQMKHWWKRYKKIAPSTATFKTYPKLSPKENLADSRLIQKDFPTQQ